MQKTILLILFSSVFSFFVTRNPAAVEIPSHDSSAAKAAFVSESDGVAMLTGRNFETHATSLYDEIGLASYQLDYKVFRLGLVGYYSLKKEGALSDKNLLTIIDFEKPSTAKRFYTIDLAKKQVLYHTYVSHGRNTGENMATLFSNTPHSNQSSLGFSVTGETYVGSKGYSLRLDGKESSFNSNVRRRAVVIHAAAYATEDWIRRYGRLGRSQGCPALPPTLSREVIDTIKDKTPIFTYYPDTHYLNTSQYLKVETLLQKLNAEPIPLTTSDITLSKG